MGEDYTGTLDEVGSVPRMGVQPKKDLSITLQALRPMGCGLPRENTLSFCHSCRTMN